MAERLRAYLVSAAVLAAVLTPLTWKPPRDSFPLSSYPMFARNRQSAVLSAVYAVATLPDGTRAYVPPRLLGTREVLQARAILDRARRAKRETKLEICRAIAGRTAAETDGPLAGAVEIRLMRGDHDALAYFDDGVLGTERVLVSCKVARP